MNTISIMQIVLPDPSTYSKERECFFVTLIALHFDIDIDGILSEIDLCVVLILCENTQDYIGLSLVPISTTINHFLSLNHILA